MYIYIHIIDIIYIYIHIYIYIEREREVRAQTSRSTSGDAPRYRRGDCFGSILRAYGAGLGLRVEGLVSKLDTEAAEFQPCVIRVG